MGLEEAIYAVVQQPHSIQARAWLAAELERADPSKAVDVWEATVRAAALRGQFFAALFFSKSHLEGRRLAGFFREMATLYSAERRSGHRKQAPPMLLPRSIRIPYERKAQRELAYRLGTNLTGLALPHDATMPDIPIFGEITTREFFILAQEIELINLQAGDVLMRQGEEGQAVYLLSHGTVRVTQKRRDVAEVELAHVKAPALLGEMSLLTQGPRRATVTAMNTGLAWRIDGALLARLEQRHLELRQSLRALFEKRLIANMLNTCRAFVGLSATQREQSLSAFRIRDIPPNSKVVAQEGQPSGLYIILHGEAEVWRRGNDGTQMRLATLSEGDFFGEFSLLTGERTSADVLMPSGGVLFHLSPETYQTLRTIAPQMEENLMDQMLVRREVLQEMVDTLSTEFELIHDPWPEDGVTEEIDADWLLQMIAMDRETRK